MEILREETKRADIEFNLDAMVHEVISKAYFNIDWTEAERDLANSLVNLAFERGMMEAEDET